MAQSPCQRTVKADVVALDQAFYNNRLGAINAGGMIYALRRDVQPTSGTGELKFGQVMLKPYKRARPIVLRANEGDCLEISFQNLLGSFPVVLNSNSGTQQFPVDAPPGAPYSPNQNKLIKQSAPGQKTFDPIASQPATRLAGVHVTGLELVSASAPSGSLAAVSADGSWVGGNDVAAVDTQKRASGLVGPGERITYTYFAKAQGSFLLYSTAADVGDQLGFGAQLMQGLFGSVTVQPKTAEWYRSQVTKADLDLATSGKTADGHPIIKYDEVYPASHPKAGQPILKMLDQNNEIVYSDLTAIITGPNHGRFNCADCPEFGKNPSYPDQSQPFREFAIHYHDDFVSTQAFEPFRKHKDTTKDDRMNYTLQGSRDFFAINYGMAGIGPEIWSNRIGVGPMHQCATCRFEEFFLSSWAVGDPAMVVDYPANSVKPGADVTADPKPGPKATKAFYPDDPSNVYHSYMGDHVKFQVLHAGTNISHVHHLHAHQWLHSPNNDTSSYRDSQMISPGGTYTMNHTFNGSGNKNKTVGDSIFHCHFYPHFAQGMWALWRVHDVFEPGTTLDDQGRPVAGFNRALPDGEIAAGTPIPALVPMPTLPMAPIGAQVKIVGVTVPGTSSPAGFGIEVNMADPNIANGPGFPFFIPGLAGQRPPHPPLDFAPDEADAANPFLNGGLPRFLAIREMSPPCTGSNVTGCLYEKHNRWDFSKFNDKLKAVSLAEDGTEVEKIAMKYHATRFHNTFLPDGTAANGNSGFVLNGRPPISGAPYADPGVDLDGNPVCADNEPPCLMRYKAANIQLNLVFNKKGQHYPQARIITLWGDVQDTLANKRAPEPFFFRANSKQVVEYWHANLVPNYYELDDFQVRTPTDIIGQHIHLVKFDVTSADGAANGFNYEDGTLSPQEVQEIIENINHAGGLFSGFDFNTGKTLTAKTIPYFGNGPNNSWLGAQATIQRWYADPILDNKGFDRTLRTVFTHDHFGPSTHQQVGLYAGLLVEPENSKWQDPLSGVFLGTNLNRPVGADGKAPDDGGPTGWQANINTADPQDSYREFAIEFQDRQLAYYSNSRSTASPYVRYADPWLAPVPPCSTVPVGGWSDPLQAISAPTNTADPTICLTPPYPSIVTLSFNTGTYSLNYRNEPVAYRVNPNVGTPSQLQTDLSHVFRSIERADTSLNTQPTGPIPNCPAPCFQFPPPQVGAENFDPYTPLLRAYEGDKVQIRTLVGAHMSPHYFTVHGINWLFEPTQFDDTNNVSGYKSTQGMGISEHYEFLFTLPRTTPSQGVGSADYFYSSSSDKTGLMAGNWGLMRGYRWLQSGNTPLVPLPNNQPPAQGGPMPVAPAICPADAPKRDFSIVAAFARNVIPGPVVYNSRGRAGQGGSNQIVNYNALAYFLEEDIDPDTGLLLPGKAVEPLILRANAGDCINITLKNSLPSGPLNSGSSWFGIPLYTSYEVGLHPQLVALDVTRSNGVNAGKNPPMTVKPGDTGKFTWYAGRIEQSGGTTKYLPVEFGSIPLTPSDPAMQHPFGMIGSLIIEPKGSNWKTDDNTRAQAVVCTGSPDCSSGEILYREFVAMVQDDVSSLRQTVGLQASTINGQPAWVMDVGNTVPLPASGVALFAGQVVNFDIPSGGGTHGLLFKDEASARAVFDIDGSPDKAKFKTFATQCGISNAFGTAPQSSGHIATLRVKQNVTVQNLPFLCSQHCASMSGTFAFGPGLKPPPTIEAPFIYTRAMNYRTEPLDYRYSSSDWISNADIKSPLGIARALSNTAVLADPQTPVFAASKDMPVRFRMIHPAGLSEQVFSLHGHVWQELPYKNGSTEIGNNPLSQWQGSRDGFGPNVSFEVVIDKAGGAAGVTGDYLYRTFIGSIFQAGLWGLFRVGEPGKDIVTLTKFSKPVGTNGKVLITGVNTVNPRTGKMAKQVTILDNGGVAVVELGKADVDPMTGVWPANGRPFEASSAIRSILVRSDGGGETNAPNYITEITPGAARPTVELPDELALFNPSPKRLEIIIQAAGEGENARWTINGPDGKPQPIADNQEIPVKPGDTIVFSIKDGTHGLTFTDRNKAEQVFHFEQPGSPFKPAGRGITTDGTGAGSVLATLKVEGDAPNRARVTFTCSEHGAGMSATFVVTR